MKQKPHSFTMIIYLSTTLLVFLLFVYGCGPSAKQIAQAEAKRNALEKKIAGEKVKLREHAEQRIKAGEAVPPRVEDPGYPVANCVFPNLSEDTAFVSFDPGFLGKVQYVCCNKEAGKSIVAWRAWYCEGSDLRISCILGKWVNGEPVFKGVLRGRRETGFENVTFIFEGCNIK